MNTSQRQTGRTFISGVALSGAAMVLLGVFNYLTRRLLALNLPADAYGFFYSALAVVGIIMTLLDLGLGQSLVVLVARYQASDTPERVSHIFRRILVIKGLGAALAGLALMLATPALTRHFFHYPAGGAVLTTLAMYILVATSCGTLLSAFAGVKDFTARNLCLVGQGMLAFLISYLTLPLLGSAAPAVAYLLASVIPVALASAYLYRRHPVFRAPTTPQPQGLFREIWLLSRWVTIAVTGVFIMTNCDTLMLTHLKGLGAVAIYNVAIPILQIFLVLLIIPSVATPLVTEQWQTGNIGEISRLCRLVVTCLVLGCGAIFLGIVHLAAPILTIFAGGLICIVLSNFYSGLAIATDCARPGALIVVGGVVFNLVSNLLLISRWGGVGAAAATVLSHALIATGSYLVLRKPLSLRLPLGLAAWTAVSIALCLLGHRILETHLANPILSTACSLALYLTLIHRPLARQLQDISAFYRPRQGTGNASAGNGSLEGKRILILFPHMVQFGGALSYTLQVAKGLRERGSEVGILTMCYSTTIEPPEDIEVQTLVGPLTSSLFYWALFPYWQWRLHRAIRNWQPDVLLPQVFPANWWGWIYKCLHPNAKLVWVCHEPSAFIHSKAWIKALKPRWKSWLGLILRPLLARIDRTLAQYSDAIVANSQFTAGACRDIYGIEPVGVAYPAVDHAVFHPDPAVTKQPQLVTAAHLSRFKNIDFLLKVFARTQQAHPDLSFVVVGRGEAREELRQLALDLGIADRVTWKENLPATELADLYRSSLLFIHGSRYEPFGMAPLEAISCGTPVLAHASGGPKEFVNETNGALMDTVDETEWSQAIERLLKLNEPLPAQIARTTASFTWSNTTAAIAQALN